MSGTRTSMDGLRKVIRGYGFFFGLRSLPDIAYWLYDYNGGRSHKVCSLRGLHYSMINVITLYYWIIPLRNINLTHASSSGAQYGGIRYYQMSSSIGVLVRSRWILFCKCKHDENN